MSISQVQKNCAKGSQVGQKWPLVCHLLRYRLKNTLFEKHVSFFSWKIGSTSPAMRNKETTSDALIPYVHLLVLHAMHALSHFALSHTYRNSWNLVSVQSGRNDLKFVMKETIILLIIWLICDRNCAWFFFIYLYFPKAMVFLIFRFSSLSQAFFEESGGCKIKNIKRLKQSYIGVF